MRRLAIALAGIAALAVGPALAAETGLELKHVDWKHAGPFGTYDRASVQRGLQVYREVCASCHGLRFVAFRALQGIGLNEDEIKAIAAEYEITDGPDDAGDMFQRPGKPSDYFPDPFENEQAAAAANGGAAPPDLSLVVKARKGGEDYLYSLLTGYMEPPSGVTLEGAQQYNPYFPGGKISMPPPLSADQVTYADGTSTTVEQMSRDVTAFLAWTAEPMLEERRRMGVKVIIFLLVFAGLMYAAKRKIWARVH